MNKAPRINKDGTPDKRYKANKVEKEESLEPKNEPLELQDIKYFRDESFSGRYDYEFLTYDDLEQKIVNMGDYLLLIPPIPDDINVRFIKIKVKDE